MFITAGLLNMLLKHFGTTQAEISEILTGLKYDYAILQNPTSLIDANILGVYLEHIVKISFDNRCSDNFPVRNTLFIVNLGID